MKINNLTIPVKIDISMKDVIKARILGLHKKKILTFKK